MRRALLGALMVLGLWTPSLVRGTAPPKQRTVSSQKPPASLFVREDLGPKPSVARQLERRTRWLVGRPYVFSPLGEGQEPDPDPRLRYDAFDCTTFVETAMALIYAERPEEVRQELDQIRYRRPSLRFEDRRHLATSQWIPDLLQSGHLRDITQAVGGSETRIAVLRLGPNRWRQRRIAKKVALDAQHVPKGRFRLPYLTLESFRAHRKHVPPGTVMNLVRVSWRLSPELITHQALILRVPGRRELIVRHASPVARKVIDEPLWRVLKRYQTPRKWPILGVNLLRVERRGGATASPETSRPPTP